MEGSKEGLSSGVTVKNDQGNQGFCLKARLENPMSQSEGPTMATTAPLVSMGGVNTSDMRKRRGRPRKYDGDVAATLSPMPISASIPLTGDFSGWKQPRARPIQTIKKAHKVEFESVVTILQNLVFGIEMAMWPPFIPENDLEELWDFDEGDRFPHFVGANFTPHMITVNAGEDITMKVMSFSQQDSRAICVLSANGSISNVTLRQPNSSGGTLTYEGRFEILSLSGSYMPTDNGIVKSRSGGMSVSLSGPDGRVLGGGLAGLLIAATPVQVVLGSFLLGHHQEQKSKKQRIEPVNTVMPAFINQASDDVGYGGQKVNFASPPPLFHTNNLPSMNSTNTPHSTHLNHSTQHYPMNLEADKVISPEGDSDDDFDDDDDSPSNLEICG